MEENKEINQTVDKKLKIFLWTLFWLSCIIDVINSILSFGDFFLMIALLYYGFYIVGAVIVDNCSNQCVLVAKKMNRNINVAYTLGFLFSIIAYILYKRQYKKALENNTTH